LTFWFVFFSLEFLANNYTLIVTTSKNNYFTTLDQTGTQTSANQNDGPVPLVGATTMYPELAQTVREEFEINFIFYLFDKIQRQIESSNSSNVLNITINHVILQFW